MISFKSSAFQNGDVLPMKYTQDGENISPPLQWAGLGTDVKEFAILCDDPDAHQEKPVVHWLIYGIDPAVTCLPEGISADADLSPFSNTRQGLNSKKQLGYMGPRPPTGDDWHHYNFKIYALKEKLALPQGATREEFDKALKGKVSASAELVGRYKRDLERAYDIAQETSKGITR